MILPFKHADRTDLLPAIMNLLQRGLWGRC